MSAHDKFKISFNSYLFGDMKLYRSRSKQGLFSNVIRKSASLVLALFLLLSSFQGVFAQEATPTPTIDLTPAPIPATDTVISTDPTSITPTSEALPVVTNPVTPAPIAPTNDAVVPQTASTLADPTIAQPEALVPAVADQSTNQMMALTGSDATQNNSPKDSIT